MNDVTIAQAKRMKELIVREYATHHKDCLLCRMQLTCPDLEWLFRVLCKWSVRLLDMQQVEQEWQQWDREQEGV